MMDEALLVKHIVGECSHDENQSVIDWMNENEANKQEYEKLASTWSKSKALETKYFNTEQAWRKFKSKNTTKTFKIGAIYKVAAAAIVLLGLFFGIKQLNPSIQTIAQVNHSDSSQLVIMSDGSQITLGQAAIEYAENYNQKQREVKLKGKAFFKVETNPNAKFIVKASNCSIEVLGTQFEVIESEDSVFVRVLEGKVAFNTPEGGKLLQKGKGAVYYTLKKTLNLIPVKANDLSYATKTLVFENQLLSKAVLDIENLYGVTIQYDNTIASKRINTIFKNEPLDKVLMILEHTLSIKVEKKGTKIVLTKGEEG